MGLLWMRERQLKVEMKVESHLEWGQFRKSALVCFFSVIYNLRYNSSISTMKPYLFSHQMPLNWLALHCPSDFMGKHLDPYRSRLTSLSLDNYSLHEIKCFIIEIYGLIVYHHYQVSIPTRTSLKCCLINCFLKNRYIILSIEYYSQNYNINYYMVCECHLF